MGKHMTDIKTPEEMAKEELFEKIAVALVGAWRRHAEVFGRQPHGTEKQIKALMELGFFREIESMFSAERNSNLEQIEKLKKQMEIYRLETIRWSDAYKPLNEKVRSLESKLEDAEKENKHLLERLEYQNVAHDEDCDSKAHTKIAKLEAEAKAVLDEIHKLCRSLDYESAVHRVIEYIESIRALNSKKGEV